MFCWLLSLIMWILEIIIVVKMQCQQSIVFTFGLYPLVVSTLIVLLQNPLSGLQGIADTSRKLANFTYYTHPIFILLISFCWKQALGHPETLNTLLFLLTAVITFVVGLLVCKLNNPVLNKYIS